MATVPSLLAGLYAQFAGLCLTEQNVVAVDALDRNGTQQAILLALAIRPGPPA